MGGECMLRHSPWLADQHLHLAWCTPRDYGCWVQGASPPTGRPGLCQAAQA